jgi:hypothetical protein
MDLVYKIAEVEFDRKYIALSNNLNLFTTIEKVLIDGSVVDNFEDMFYLMDKEEYIYQPNEKFSYNEYSIMWNETKSKVMGDEIYEIIFYTDDDIKQHINIDHELVNQTRKKANLKYRKHKIKKVLDDDVDMDINKKEE